MQFLLLLFCSVRVAHRQFQGAYGPSSSIRSNIPPFGLGPMSARNLSKDPAHSEQTLIPRPP